MTSDFLFREMFVPMIFSRNKRLMNLRKFDSAEAVALCDYCFDNLSGDMFGVVELPGYPTKMIPTTTMMNNYVFWALVGSYVAAMELRGEAPYYWMSLHVPGGKEYVR